MMINTVINQIFMYVLTLIFVIFKILGQFDHSWWWVFIPVYVGTILDIIHELCKVFMAGKAGQK